MPFSRENRMSTLLIGAILITLGIGVSSIVSIVNHSTNSPSTPVITSIIGFVGIAVNQFLGMLKTEFNRKEARAEAERLREQASKVERTTNEVKDTLQLTQRKQERKLDRLLLGQTGDTALLQAGESTPGLEMLPLSTQELEELIRKVVRETCIEKDR